MMHSECAWLVLMTFSAYICARASFIIAHFVFIWLALMYIITVKLFLYTKAYKRSEVIASLIHSFDTRWKWVICFTLRPNYLWGKSPDTHWIAGWVINTDLHTHCVLCMYLLDFWNSQIIFTKILGLFCEWSNRTLSIFSVQLSVIITWLTRTRVR